MLIYNNITDTKDNHSISLSKATRLSRPKLSPENKTYLVQLGFKLK